MAGNQTKQKGQVNSGAGGGSKKGNGSQGNKGQASGNKKGTESHGGGQGTGGAN